MDFNNNNYINRLIDKKVSHYLNVVGALNIVGPKWCGKTWTSKYHSKSFITFDNPNTVIQANSDLDSVLNYEKPELIDEWNRVPQIWDRVRNKCDETSSTGNYILTCSTILTNDEQKKNIFHSGAGRIAKINMYTMSLYEFGDSTGEVSLTDLLENTQKSLISKRKYTINEIANFIIRGGCPLI